MLLIYTNDLTNRLKFVFNQICNRILSIPISFTTKVETFISHEGPKISYAPQALGNEFFIKSHGLLFDQGISDVEINVQNWKETKCFFYSGENSNLPFDIFSAAFYLLSRYEEYLPHVKDNYGRFTKNDSIAFKYNFLTQPVVDIWALYFKEALQQHFPKQHFPSTKFSIEPVIDVPMAYYFKSKGLFRTLGGIFSDLINFRFQLFYDRFFVLSKLKKDPYDNFEWIINSQKKLKQRFTIFFLVGDYTKFDKNISITKKSFITLIKSMRDYCEVGLKCSYMALGDLIILKKEKQELDGVLNTTTEKVRSSFSKVNLPSTYRNYVELEIKKDYSMGYPDEIGFRAGTSFPFLFYDIDFEVQTPLIIHPYQLMDFSLLKFDSFLDKKETLEKAINEVKKVGGVFTPIFHNYSFSKLERWTDFKSLFNIILDSTDEI